MVTKAELIAALAPLADTDEVWMAITTRKDEDDDFTIGDADAPNSLSTGENDDENEDDGEEGDNTIDNEDGTETDLYPLTDIRVITDAVDPETNEPMKYAAVHLDMTEEDEDEDEPDASGSSAA